MTTHYVRDESGFREARPNDVLERAQALLSQRYRVGPRGRGLHHHLVYARRPDDPARHPPAAP